MNGSAPIYSTWRVPEAGYRWVSRQGERRLVEEPVTTPVRLYDPIQDRPALFRRFAELDPEESPILAFANEYGLLGIPRESLQAWTRHIARMRDVVALLYAADRGDAEAVARWITLQQTAMGISATLRRGETGSRETLRPEDDDLARYLEPTNRVLAARFFADKIINGELEAHSSARMLYDPRDGSHELHVAPSSLLGALWIQAGDLAAGRRDYQKCEQCGTWFALSPDTSRADRRFCSDRCRTRAYRERKDEARRLHQRGMSPSAIARKLGSKTQTIREWLGMKPAARSRRK